MPTMWWCMMACYIWDQLSKKLVEIQHGTHNDGNAASVGRDYMYRCDKDTPASCHSHPYSRVRHGMPSLGQPNQPLMTYDGITSTWSCFRGHVASTHLDRSVCCMGTICLWLRTSIVLQIVITDMETLYIGLLCSSWSGKSQMFMWWQYYYSGASLVHIPCDP